VKAIALYPPTTATTAKLPAQAPATGQTDRTACDRDVPRSRLSFSLISMMFMVLLAGCVRLGSPFEPVPLPPGAPSVDTILSSLAANEAALRTFRAAGTIMVQIPEIEATQISRESSLFYEAPGRLNIIGRRYGTRGIELTYVDDAFLIEFPTRKEYCLQDQAKSFETLSSADIVREMFCPEIWESINQRDVRITAFDEAEKTATVEFWITGRHPWCKRVIKVQGAPWVILENVLLNENKEVVARTFKKDYHEQEGIRYPTEIESTYPGEEAWMRFIMRRVDLNLPPDPLLFDLAEREKELKKSDFTRVDIFAGEGPSLEDLNTGGQS